jgi:protein-disulfide isomerase
MPSGKRARQQRQAAAAAAPPPVRSKGAGGARARQASPRSLAIAGGVALVVIIAVVLGIVLNKGGSGGSNIPTKADLQGLPAVGSQKWSGALQGAQEANDLFKGIPQNGLVLGDPKAPVTMEMFIDVQCPVCDDYEVNYLSSVVQDYVRPGKVQLHLQPWAFLGTQSFSGRLGLIAAAAQNKGFNFAKVLYDNQPSDSENTGYLNGKWLAGIAASTTGLKLQEWRTATNGPEAQSVATAVDNLAKKKNVSGTPTIFVGCTGGKLKAAMPAGAYQPQNVEPALNAAVAACGK